MTTPIIGTQPGEFMEADIPGHYHRITDVSVSDRGIALTEFEFYPEYKMVDGTLVPISQAEAEEAFITLRRKYA